VAWSKLIHRSKKKDELLFEERKGEKGTVVLEESDGRHPERGERRKR